MQTFNLHTIFYRLDSRLQFRIFASDEGLAEAKSFIEEYDGTIVDEKVTQEKSITEYTGSSTDRFTRFYMNGLNKVEGVTHHCTGTMFYNVFTAKSNEV
jgi:hypothetical protein